MFSSYCCAAYINYTILPTVYIANQYTIYEFEITERRTEHNELGLGDAHGRAPIQLAVTLAITSGRSSGRRWPLGTHVRIRRLTPAHARKHGR